MRIVAMMSGGSDSAYATYIAKKKYYDAEFFPLFIDYEQPEALPEMRASIDAAVRLGIPRVNWHEIAVQDLYLSGLFAGRDKNNVDSVYVPLRNLMLTALAASYAESIGATVVTVGNKSPERVEGEILGYDGNQQFYTALQNVVNMAQMGSEAMRIEAPLAELAVSYRRKLSREDVYFGLWTIGFKYQDTFSCWFPKFIRTSNEKFQRSLEVVECGECKNCLEKKDILKRWQEASGITT